VSRARTIRIVSAVAAVVAVFFGAWVLQGRIASEREGTWQALRRDDLVIGVNVSGTLQSIESARLGPPPLPGMWNYKISMMAPEGNDVRPGQPVLAFDSSELQRMLEQKSAEAEEARKSIEQKEADLRLKLEDEELKLAESESKLRKAALKLEAPSDILPIVERKSAELERDRAVAERNRRRARVEAMTRAARAEVTILRNKQTGAEAKVAEIQRSIAAMTLRAPRPGIVVHLSNWRGEKKKVGDNTWGSEKVVEIPDLTRMKAQGEVEEADGGKLAVGQRVSLRLDAHPDVEFTGTIASIGKTVQPRSAESRMKVLRVEITLAETDPARMRPGMRFQGKVELQRVPRTVLLPLEAIAPGANGPVVRRRSAFGAEVVPVRVGRRNEQYYEVLEGLKEGDRVLLRGAAAEGSKG
jgi:HlyD family secretion protein